MLRAAREPDTGRTSLDRKADERGFRLRDSSWCGPEAGTQATGVATLRAPYGSPQEEDVEGAPRPASRDARARDTAREYVPSVRLAEAGAPGLPDLRHVQG